MNNADDEDNDNSDHDGDDDGNDDAGDDGDDYNNLICVEVAPIYVHLMKQLSTLTRHRW